jgi:DMSO/TMAO reductase YedYZ molybdopterin-dependent catalytic subunit
MTQSEKALLARGQYIRSRFTRFGLLAFAMRWPKPVDHPVLEISGEVETALSVDVADVFSNGRKDQVSDFHCVTTWSHLGVVWSGVSFKDFYENFIVPNAHPNEHVSHVQFKGADGYRSAMFLEDALADDVMLVDQLNGEPLSLAHGAPLRLIAPANYGYKSTKHLVKITFTETERLGVGGPLVHPRARVALEERGLYLPGWAYRVIYQAVLPIVFWIYRRNDRG